MGMAQGHGTRAGDVGPGAQLTLRLSSCARYRPCPVLLAHGRPHDRSQLCSNNGVAWVCPIQSSQRVGCTTHRRGDSLFLPSLIRERFSQSDFLLSRSINLTGTLQVRPPRPSSRPSSRPFPCRSSHPPSLPSFLPSF